MSEPQSPPLSIRHLLYLTLGVAVATWLNLSGLRAKPTTVVAGVALASRVLGAFTLGGLIASFTWLTCRWLTRSPVKLQDPGSIFVLAVSLMRIAKFTGAIVGLLLFNYLQTRNLRAWDQVACLLNITQDSLVAFIAIYAAIKVRELPWKIIFACAVLLSVISIYRMIDIWWQLPNYQLPPKSTLLAWVRIRLLLQYIPIVAVIFALLVDWRKKTPRHWLHYVGIVIFALTAMQFLLFQSVGSNIHTIFP